MELNNDLDNKNNFNNYLQFLKEIFGLKMSKREVRNLKF